MFAGDVKKELAMLPDTKQPVLSRGGVINAEDYFRSFHRPQDTVIIAQSPQVAQALYPDAPSKLNFVGAFVMDAGAQTGTGSSATDDDNKHGTGNGELDRQSSSLIGEQDGGVFGGRATLAAIREFIDRDLDRKPIYMGWGSMTCKSPEHMVQLCIKALEYSGHRGIVLGGWARLSLELLESVCSNRQMIDYAKANVLFVAKAPHEWLFPRVACAVHHGGAGTTNAALRAGIPQVITPVWLDQYNHAQLVEKLGVGIGTKQFQRLNAMDLAGAITDTLMTRHRTAKVGDAERATDGCERTNTSGVCTTLKTRGEWSALLVWLRPSSRESSELA